jgi:hypothetical protein
VSSRANISSTIEIYTSSDVSAITNLECKLGFMIVGALATSKNVINCEFASSKLQGNISVEVLHDGLVFSNSLVLQIVNVASVFSVSKRFIGTSGGSVVETHFRHNLPSNANLWCRFDTLVVIPASISLLSAICLSPPLAEGLTTFSLLVDDQTFSDEILLTVIPLYIYIYI